MSCFDVKILDPDINTITIETCIGDQPSSIDIVTYDNANTIEINSCVALLPSEINDLITVKNILAGSGIAVVSTSGIYTISLNDPNLTSSDISDFLESVQDIIGQSGLSAGNYVNLSYNDTTGLTTISVTGLQPSGNYSLVGHTHTSSNITDFDSSVSGLLPVKNITGSGSVNVSSSSGNFTVSVTGIAVSGHTHTSSDITNFNSSVSGLLPVKNITAGSGIGLTSVFGDFTISVTGSFGLTSEEVDDRVSNLLVAGNYVHLNYNDNSNSLTISVTGLQPSGNYSVVGHTHVTNDITDFNNAVSGLIPPSNFTSLSGISGVTVSNSGTNYIVSLTDPTIQLADITDLASNARTFLLTPSSSNLSILISDETGSGSLVFNNSPAFSGTPTVPTAPSGTNDTQIASTAFVRTEIINLIDSAPTTLDTLNELAAALGDDPNFATTVTNSLADKASLSGAVFIGPVTIPSGTGNFNSLTVNDISVSLSGHLHSTSDITNFSSGVSGLLPNVTGINYITSSFSNNTYSIGVTGLQPSGNYSVVGHSHVIADVSGLQNVLDSKQPSGIYASGVHYHVSSDITDFNSSVSGLIPVKNILSGTGINISNASGIYTIESTGSGVLSDQAKSLVTIVFNKTGSPIPKMTAVYIDGGQGDLPTVSLAIATSDMTSAGTYGLTYETISNMQSGKVIVFGALTGLDTDQFNPSAPMGNVNGSVIYLSPSVSGALTLTKPSAPNHIVAIGTIVRTHQNEGVIEVRVQNGFELEELHNVAISGASNGQFLQYNSSSGLWIPSSSGNFTTLSVNGTGVSLSGHNHISSDITDFNSAVSGLLPVTNILGGNNISVSVSGSVYNVAVTGSLGLTTEEVDDRVSNLLVEGTGISIVYNDVANTLNISTKVIPLHPFLLMGG